MVKLPVKIGVNHGMVLTSVMVVAHFMVLARHRRMVAEKKYKYKYKYTNKDVDN